MAMWPMVQVNTLVWSLHNNYTSTPVQNVKRETLNTIIVLIIRFECCKHKGGCGISRIG